MFLPQSGGTDDLSLDVLLDLLVSLHKEVSELKGAGDSVAAFVERNREHVQNLLKGSTNASHFDVIQVLGRGAYGEVRLVRHRQSRQVMAMKLMTKSKIRGTKDAAYFREERDVMALSDSEWLTKLHFAFQDDKYIYLVMEYNQGGNLLTQLYKDDLFDEPTARFYMAESVLATHALHELGFVHRDLKPENLMLDSQGHIKVADFGTCVRVDNHGEAFADTPIGTPEYISPEMLKAQDKGGSRHGFGVDWWALGIILFEMLFGEVPFYSESLLEMYGSIQKFNNPAAILEIPDDPPVSEAAKDLCKKLICSRDKRLEYDAIIKHPFFASIDWAKLRTTTPPYVPALADEIDTSNFEEVEDGGVDPLKETAKKRQVMAYVGEDLPFIGYSFSRERFLAGSERSQRTESKVSTADFERLKQQLLLQEKEIIKLQEENETRTTTLENLRSSWEQGHATRVDLEQHTADSEKTVRRLTVADMFKTTAVKAQMKSETEAVLERENKLTFAESRAAALREQIQAEKSKLQALIDGEIKKSKDDQVQRETKIIELRTNLETLNKEIDSIQKLLGQLNSRKDSAERIITESAQEKLKAQESERAQTDQKIAETEQKLSQTALEAEKRIQELKLEKQKLLDRLETEKKVLSFQIRSLKKKNREELTQKVVMGSINRAQSKKIITEGLKNEQQLETEKEQNRELAKRAEESKKDLEQLKVTLSEVQEENQKVKSANLAASELSVLPEVGTLPAQISGNLRVKRPGPKYSRFGFKKVFVVFKGSDLDIYNTEEDHQRGVKPYFQIDLKCGVLIVAASSAEDTRNVAPHEANLVFSIYNSEGDTYNPKAEVDFDAALAQPASLDIEPVLFMAKNPKEKSLWMLALQHYRDQFVLGTN